MLPQNHFMVAAVVTAAVIYGFYPEMIDELLIDPDQDGLFTAHLFHLENHLYLDLFPEEPQTVSDFYKGHVVPAHSVWKVEISGDVLTLSVFESSRMQEAIGSGQLELDYVDRDGVQVLTSSSDALRKMLIEHRADFFGEDEVMRRIQ